MRCALPLIVLSLTHSLLAAQGSPASDHAAIRDSFTVAFRAGSLPAGSRYPFIRERVRLLDGRTVLDDSIPPACIAADTLGAPLAGVTDAVRFIDSTAAWRRFHALGAQAPDEFEFRAAILIGEGDLGLSVSEESPAMLEALTRNDPPVFSTWCQGLTRYYVWMASRGKLYNWIHLSGAGDPKHGP